MSPPSRALTRLTALFTGALLSAALVSPTAAHAVEQPIVGTVISIRAYALPSSGAILTDVTLATSDGTRTFTMRGGTLGARGMLTEEFTELDVADRVVVTTEDPDAPVLELTDAPIVVSGTGGVSASAVTDYIYTGHKWSTSDMPLTWRFNSTNAPSGAQALIQAAANTWEADPGSDIDFTYGGTTSSVPGNGDGVNSIGWRQNVSGGNLATCVIWFYNTQATLGYNRITEFDIDFNRSYTWVNGSVGGSFDIQSVALHELGHSLHLGDLHNATPTSSQEVMNGYVSSGELQRVLGAGDLAGARAIYPPANPYPPPPPPDTTAPRTSASLAPADWSQGPVNVTLSATDDQSGVAGTFYRLASAPAVLYSSPLSVSSEGVTVISYWSTDASGNAEAPQAADVRIDRTAPTITSDALDRYIGEANVRLLATDSLSGVSRITYRVDGGPLIEVPRTIAAIALTALGDHRIDFTAEDLAGNTSTGVSRFRIDARDSAAPVTMARGIPSGWTSGTVTFSLSTSDGDLAATYISIGSAASTRYTGPVVIDTEGETPIRFWSVDLAGNVESATVVFVRIDRTKPSMPSTAAPIYKGSALVTLTASDELSGVERIMWRIDQQDWQHAATATAGILTAKPGRRSVSYQAIDAAGNVLEGSVAFTVMTPARLSIAPAAPVTVTRRRGVAQMTLSGVARRPDGSRIARASVILEKSVNGRRWSYVTRVGSSTTGSFAKRLTFRSAGTTYWRWRVTSSTTLGHDSATSRSLRIRVR